MGIEEKSIIESVSVDIQCLNSAFYMDTEDYQRPEIEVARILRKLANNIEANGIENTTHILKDAN
ncbi:MAG: hypothetical protein GY941_30335, partial [Planctomycetes bacterium]|nr:hypothetical protein [Planctomycetota bacterium]